MSKARERRKKRKKREAMAQRANSSLRQIVPEGTIEMPEINMPSFRWYFFIPAGIILVLVVIFALGRINPNDERLFNNAIWLDSDWSYNNPTDEQIAELSLELQRHDIGSVYVYVSSLRDDITWSGEITGRNRFNDVQDNVASFVTRLKAVYPTIEAYAWIEIATTSASGYRLDNLRVHDTVANFANLMINGLGFDGVIIDTKPLFDENEDFPVMLRTIRAEIGLDTPMLVAVPADLTPTDAEIVQPEQIAPGTEWSDEYKQRVALQADTIVINAYNSYRENPVDYIEWVTYQVDDYVAALTQIDTSVTVLVSVPNFPANPPAHLEDVESLEAGLDGVKRGIAVLDEGLRELVIGVAVYSEAPMTDSDWRIYRQKWLE